MKEITIQDCEELYKKFMEYTETAEQHQFPILVKLQLMMEHSLSIWRFGLDQKEAGSMLRAVKMVTGIRLEGEEYDEIYTRNSAQLR